MEEKGREEDLERNSRDFIHPGCDHSTPSSSERSLKWHETHNENGTRHA